MRLRVTSSVTHLVSLGLAGRLAAIEGHPDTATAPRSALVQAALGATRTKNSAVAARYRRIRRHRGHKKAIVAVAHNLLVTAYHVLASQTTYQELGADYYDRRHTERVARRAVQTLEQQGYRVTLERVA